MGHGRSSTIVSTLGHARRGAGLGLQNRDAPMVEALDRLRALRETAAPRLMVVIGASGSGKSSFLRAGLGLQNREPEPRT